MPCAINPMEIMYGREYRKMVQKTAANVPVICKKCGESLEINKHGSCAGCFAIIKKKLDKQFAESKKRYNAYINESHAVSRPPDTFMDKPHAVSRHPGTFMDKSHVFADNNTLKNNLIEHINSINNNQLLIKILYQIKEETPLLSSQKSTGSDPDDMPSEPNKIK